MNKATHECPVVEIVLNKHDNADSLSVIPIEGYTQVVGNTAQWQGRTRGVYIAPQNYVPVTRPEFAFLAKKVGQEWHLVKGCKLRGVLSNGLLVPVPNDTPVGEDWAEKLGVKHKEDEPDEKSSDCVGGPSGLTITKYDIDGPKHFIGEFIEGEEVVVTMKIHGTNSKFIFKDDKIYVGGRTQWLKENNNHPIWNAFNRNLEILEFCKTNKDMILWGEVYNCQGKYNYGLPPKINEFAAFDIKRFDGTWLDYDEFSKLCNSFKIKTTPIVYRGPWTHQKMIELCETTPNLIGGSHNNEGIVVKPIKERQTRRFNRLIYKLISTKFDG